MFSEMEEAFVAYRNEKMELVKVDKKDIDIAEEILPEELKKLREKGKQYVISSIESELALIVMAGGMSGRYHRSENQLPKQLDFDKLFSNTMESIYNIINKKWRVVIYLVCSPRNIEEFYKNFKGQDKFIENQRVYICKQHEVNVLDQFGVETIEDMDSGKTLAYSSGIGNILKSQIEIQSTIKTIEDHLLEENFEFVYCYGISNYEEKGIDTEFLGMMIDSEDLGMLFKCTEALSQDEAVPRVVKKRNRKRKGNEVEEWEVMEYEKELLISKLSPENQKTFEDSYVWMNHFIFRMKNFVEYRTENQRDGPIRGEYEFLKRTLTSVDGQQLHCIIPERKISALLMSKYFKCKGLEVQRSKFMPIRTLEDVKFITVQTAIQSKRKIKKGSMRRGESLSKPISSFKEK